MSFPKISRRIESGEVVIWQRQTCNVFSGKILAFCPKGIAIGNVLNLSEYDPKELRRIDLNRDQIDRYLIYVQNIGVVSVATKTIEKQNPDARRAD